MFIHSTQCVREVKVLVEVEAENRGFHPNQCPHCPLCDNRGTYVDEIGGFLELEAKHTTFGTKGTPPPHLFQKEHFLFVLTWIRILFTCISRLIRDDCISIDDEKKENFYTGK